MSEVIKLRVGIARVAQARGYEREIPGVGDEREVPYERLCVLAATQERGWHRLLNFLTEGKEA